MVVDCNAQIGLEYDGVFHSPQKLIDKMDALGIDYALISSITGNCTKYQNDETYVAFQQFPKRFLPVAMINPCEPNCVEEVHRCLKDLKFKAVRFYAHRQGYYPENSLNLHALLKAIRGYRCPVIVHTGLSTLGTPQQWFFYAQDYPDIPFIFNHMGLFDFGYGCIDLAKKSPNIYLETSGQFEVQILDKALQELPIDRLLFGTDWPFKVTEIEKSKFDFFKLKKEDSEKLFGDNAKELFKL